MLETKSQLIAGALLASGILSDCYGRPWDAATKVDAFWPGASEAGVRAEAAARAEEAAARAEEAREERARAAAAARAEEEARREQERSQQRLLDAVGEVIDENGIAGLIARLDTLYAEGADPTVLSPNHQTPWHYVRSLAVCEWLRNHGALPLIDQQDNDGRTALQHLVLFIIRGICTDDGGTLNRLNILRMLLAYGANPFPWSNMGRTARRTIEARRTILRNRGDLSPEVQTQLEEPIRMLEAAEGAYLVVHPNARRDAIDVLRGRRDIIQEILSDARQELEYAFPWEWREVAARIQGAERALMIMAAGEELESVLDEIMRREDLKWGLWETTCDAIDASGISKLEALLTAGANVMTSYPHNNTVLHCVRYSAALKCILDHGAWPLIDRKSDYGWTPSHSAALYICGARGGNRRTTPQEVDTIPVLLEYGANSYAMNDYGETPRQVLETRCAEMAMRGEVLPPAAQGALEESIRLLELAERATPAFQPNAREKAIASLVERKDIIRAKRDERQAKLAALLAERQVGQETPPRMLAQIQRLENEIRKLQWVLTIIAAAETSMAAAVALVQGGGE
jgi:hypothetical protein